MKVRSIAWPLQSCVQCSKGVLWAHDRAAEFILQKSCAEVWQEHGVQIVSNNGWSGDWQSRPRDGGDTYVASMTLVATARHQ